MLGCKDCAFNFSGICAGARYGSEVEDFFKFECKDFKISLEYFSNLDKKYNIDLYDQYIDEK